MRVLTGAGAILTGITLWLVFRQLHVMNNQQETMRHQTNLMEGQLHIAERQDAIVLEQLRKQSVLRVFARVAAQADAETVWIEILAENTGSKTARDFYWDLYVSMKQVGDVLRRQDGSHYGVAIPVDIGGVEHRHYSDIVRTPLYPTRQTTLGRLLVNRRTVQGSLRLRWHIVAEDGLFPPSGETEEAVVSV